MFCKYSGECEGLAPHSCALKPLSAQDFAIGHTDHTNMAFDNGKGRLQ